MNSTLLDIQIPRITNKKETMSTNTISKLNPELFRRFSRKPSYNSITSQESSTNSSLPRISGYSAYSTVNVFDRLHSAASPGRRTPVATVPPPATPAPRSAQRSGCCREDVSVEEFERSVFKCRRWLSALPDRFYGLESAVYERALRRNSSLAYDVTEKRNY